MTQKMRSMAAAVALMAAKLAFAGSDGGCPPVWDQRFHGIGLIGSRGTVEVEIDDSPTFLAYGQFTSPTGDDPTGLSKLTDDGWRPIAFPPGSLSATRVDCVMRRIGDSGEDELWIGGEFREPDGDLIGGVARFDGTSATLVGAPMMIPPTSGSTYPPEPAQVYSITELDLNGVRSVYATGRLGVADGVTLTGVARWNGSAWEPVAWTGPGPIVGLNWASGTGVMPTENEDRLYAWSNGGCVYVFDGLRWSPLYDCTRATCVLGGVRWAVTLDAGSGPKLTVGTDNEVLSWSGARWETFPTNGFTNFSNAVSNDGEVFAITRISTGPTTSAMHVVRWSATNWEPVGSLPFGTPTTLKSLSVSAGNQLLVIGPTAYSDIDRVTRWDGYQWRELEQDSTPDGPLDAVRSIFPTIEDGGTVIYIAGEFEQINDLSVHGFSRWDGQSWSAPADATYRRLQNTRVRGPEFVVFNTQDGPRLHALRDVWGVQALVDTTWVPVRIPGQQQVIAGGNFAGLVTLTRNGQEQLYLGSQLLKVFSTFGHPNPIDATVASWNGERWSALPAFPVPPDPTIGPLVPQTLRVLDAGDGAHLYAGLVSSTPNRGVAGVARFENDMWNMLDDGPIINPLRSDISAIGAVSQGPASGIYASYLWYSVSGGSAIRHWNGSTWSEPIGIDGSRIGGHVYSLEAAFINNKHVLLAGGAYLTIYKPNATTYPTCLVAAWDGERWESIVDRPASDTTSVVYAMSATRQRGQPLLLLAGEFANVAGVSSWNFAQATLCTSMCAGDVNFDGHTDVIDLSQLLANFGATTTDPNFGPDINDDGVVNNADLSMMLAAFGYGC